MANNEYKYTPVTLMVKDEEKSGRVSAYFIDMISNMVDEEQLSQLRRGVKSTDEIIRSLGLFHRDNDPKAYAIFEETLEYISGNYMKTDSYMPRLISEHMDIAYIFNTHTKVNDFLYFMMMYTMSHKVNEHIPVVVKDTMIIYELSFLLKIVEEFIVEKYKANRDEVKTYLKYHFIFNKRLAFLVNSVWGYTYSLMGIKPDMMLKGKRGWTDSVNSDSSGNEYSFRGITFSSTMFEQRLNNMRDKGIKHELNYGTYVSFIKYIESGDLRQMCYGKAANVMMKKDDSIVPFLRY